MVDAGEAVKYFGRRLLFAIKRNGTVAVKGLDYANSMATGKSDRPNGAMSPDGADAISEWPREIAKLFHQRFGAGNGDDRSVPRIAPLRTWLVRNENRPIGVNHTAPKVAIAFQTDHASGKRLLRHHAERSQCVSEANRCNVDSRSSAIWIAVLSTDVRATNRMVGAKEISELMKMGLITFRQGNAHDGRRMSARNVAITHQKADPVGTGNGRDIERRLIERVNPLAVALGTTSNSVSLKCKADRGSANPVINSQLVGRFTILVGATNVEPLGFVEFAIKVEATGTKRSHESLDVGYSIACAV
jgi:hypothetical protein